MYAVRFRTGDVLHVFAASPSEATRLACAEWIRLYGQGELPEILSMTEQHPARMEFK